MSARLLAGALIGVLAIACYLAIKAWERSHRRYLRAEGDALTTVADSHITHTQLPGRPPAPGTRPPAAATGLPLSPGRQRPPVLPAPPPGPPHHHNTGGVAYTITTWRCGCVIARDGRGVIFEAHACPGGPQLWSVPR